MRQYLSALTLFLCVLPLDARLQQQTCGTHVARSREELQLHRQSRRLESERVQKRALTRLSATDERAAQPVLRPDIGEIAIIDDSDGVVARRNPFNLNRTTLRFVPAPGKYTYTLAEEDTFDTTAPPSGTRLTLQDDDSNEVALPFAFPFFGETYTSLFVNSDGNVTFGAGDAAITDRSLGRFTSGAPRIAALFSDLDPSRPRGSVTATALADRFVVSWTDVPLFSELGGGAPQTFQMRLYRDGRVELSWSSVTVTDAVVGITPGRLAGNPSIISFLTTPRGENTSTIAERFAGEEEVDLFSAAQKFYMNHEDSYDYLVFYNTLGLRAGSDSVAFEVTVRNSRKGYGDEVKDAGSSAGSKRRLQALLNMGPLSQYPRDPFGKISIRPIDSPVTTLAHEAGHLFLAFASVRDEGNDHGRPMLTDDHAHWNFFFNSEASLLEGNRIIDNGPGVSPRFQTVALIEKYSPLDEYLMGFRAPEEVPDTFFVTEPTLRSYTRFPRVGAAFDGKRRDVSVSELIQVEGRRVPDHTVSQRRFRFGFVLITPAGQEPTVEQIQQVDDYRKSFESFYPQATSNRAQAETSHRKALRISTWPATGVVVGGTGSGSVEVERPAQSSVTVLLRSSRGAIESPASVVIPAGNTKATFQLRGIREGTDELIAEVPGGLYAAVYSMVQVQPTAGLQVVIESGDMQAARSGVPLGRPVQFRVTDSNNLPYAGVALTGVLTGGGALQSATVNTDEAGIASFRWTPGGGARNELTVTLPNGSSATATALGRPAFTSEAVVNAASFRPGLTPGGIGTVFGSNLAGLGTAEVLLNGEQARVFYANTGQLNFYVPDTLASGTVDVVIRQAVGSSDPVRVPVSTVQPGIFFDAATGFGAVLTAGTGALTQVRPVSRGETIEIYATGLGAAPQARTEVRIGGMAAEVSYSGPAPGFLGLNQVNARVPAGVQPGAAALQLSVDGVPSNEVRVQVR